MRKIDGCCHLTHQTLTLAMAFPSLHSVATSRRTPVSLSSSPQPSSQRHLSPYVGETSSVCEEEEVHLPMLAATSLRPAKPSRRAPSAPAPTRKVEVVLEREDSHPLLHQLLSDSCAAAPLLLRRPFLLPTVEAPSSLSWLNDAIDEVGGANKVERLLHELQDFSQREKRVENDVTVPAVQVAVQRCVETTLELAQGAVRVSSAADDSSMLDVQIPLPVPTRPANGRKGVQMVDPCLLLRLHRQRGVLSLHVINVCYDGPNGDVEPHATRRRRRLHEPTAPQRNTEKQRDGIHGGGPAAQPALPEANPASALLSHSSSEMNYAQLCAALGRQPQVSSKAHTMDVSSGLQATASCSPPTALERRNGSRSSRNTRKTRGRRDFTHTSHTRTQAAEFDPLHPEETTPFNAEHRPLTFNAAIVFS